jgi:1,4-dihydroxy-2-naphthoate octaprenyltransferase
VAGILLIICLAVFVIALFFGVWGFLIWITYRTYQNAKHTREREEERNALLRTIALNTPGTPHIVDQQETLKDAASRG